MAEVIPIKTVTVRLNRKLIPRTKRFPQLRSRQQSPYVYRHQRRRPT